MKKLKDFINKKNGKDIRRIISSGTDDYTSLEVSLAKNVCDIDPQNDITFSGKYFHVRFLSTEDSVGLVTGIDEQTLNKDRELLIFVTEADMKSSERLVWDIYRAMATQFTKGGYVDAARRWGAAEKFELSPEDCEDLAMDRWAFEQMGCPTFLGKFELPAMERMYLTTFLNTESTTSLIFLKKNTKWNTVDDKGNKAKDQGLGSKYSTPPSVEPIQKKSSDVSGYLQTFGLPSRTSFEECMKLIKKNYGGKSAGPDIVANNITYRAIGEDEKKEILNWSDKRFAREKSNYAIRGMKGSGNLFETPKTKEALIPEHVYEKIVTPQADANEALFRKYEESIKKHVLKHFDQFLKSTSVIDRNKEELIVNELIKKLIANRPLSESDVNAAIDATIDRSLEKRIQSVLSNRTYLSMNERMEMKENGTLPEKFEGTIPDWMYKEYIERA